MSLKDLNPIENQGFCNNRNICPIFCNFTLSTAIQNIFETCWDSSDFCIYKLKNRHRNCRYLHVFLTIFSYIFP